MLTSEMQNVFVDVHNGADMLLAEIMMIPAQSQMCRHDIEQLVP